MSTIDGTLAIHRPSTEEIDLQADWREPIDHASKPMTSDNLNDWLYVNGSAAPFNVKIKYVPSRNSGPVVGRGISGAEEDMEMEADEEFSEDFESQMDAREMPVLPEAVSRAVPKNTGNMEEDAELAEGEVIERAVSKGRARQPVQKKAGPPPYDERSHRCAPAPPAPPPANYGERLRFQGLHRFGDTKYRCVAYTAIGTTRYREYFRPIPDEETALLQSGKLPPRWTRSSSYHYAGYP